MKNKIISLMQHGRWYTSREITDLVNGGKRGATPLFHVRIVLHQLLQEGVVGHKPRGHGDAWCLTLQEPHSGAI